MPVHTPGMLVLIMLEMPDIKPDTNHYVGLTGQSLHGSLHPPQSQDGSQSPGGSPTKGHYSHSAHTSPTNTTKLRPRAKSTETGDKKNWVSVSSTRS